MFHGWQYLKPEDREAILRGIADGEVHGGPYHLELDWVDKCNARCFFCNSEELQKGQTLPWGRAAELLEEARLNGLRSVRLSGGGEPTLHPNLPDLLEFLGRNEIVLDHLNTNGTMLNERVVEALQLLPVNDVRISLNYCDEATYATGMGLPAKFFGRVCEMTRNLAEARRNNPRFGRLTIQFFVYKPTLHQIPQMYRLARELGADLIVFRELFEIDPALYYTAGDVPAIVGGLREALREDWREGRIESTLQSNGAGEAIRELYASLREEFGDAPPRAPREIDYSNRYCYIAWYSMTIMGNQAVYPCCFLLPVSWLPPLDNVATKSLQEVWRGPAYAKFRSEMRGYYLLQQRVPLFKRRNEKSIPGCHSHDECPLTPSMCDDAFYAEAEARLRVARAKPAVAAWRAVNHAGIAVEKLLGKR